MSDSDILTTVINITFFFFQVEINNIDELNKYNEFKHFIIALLHAEDDLEKFLSILLKFYTFIFYILIFFDN